MKKLTLSLLSLVLTLAMCLCAGAEAVDYTGAWLCTGIEMAGITIDPSVLGMDMLMTLNEDGTCTLEALGQTESGTWAVTETGITTTDAAGTVDAYTYVDGVLTAEQEGMKIVFTPAEAAEAAETINVRANVPLADFQDTWVLEHVEVSDGQFFTPEELDISYELVFDAGADATFSVTSEGETVALTVITAMNELVEEADLGTVLYMYLADPADPETPVEVLPLLLYEDDQLVWYQYEETDELEIFYCFDRKAE